MADQHADLQTMSPARLREYAIEQRERISELERSVRNVGALVEASEDALKDERQQRENERAMWRERTELWQSQTKTNEQDVIALQNLLGIICDTGTEHLAALLEWAWSRSTPEEIMSMTRQRDVLWQMVGMCRTFTRDARGE